MPFPPRSDDEVVEAILAHAGPRTRLAVISHVTSPTALILPIQRIVSALAERGIDTLVDGAHTGMVPMNLDELGRRLLHGQCPQVALRAQGSGLSPRPPRPAGADPAAGHLPRRQLSRGPTGHASCLEFDWTGTADPTAYLAIPAALDFFDNLLPGGYWQAMAINRDTAAPGARALGGVAAASPLPPDSMIGAMATVELPADLAPLRHELPADAPPGTRWPADPLHAWLLSEHAIQVPVYAWPHTPEPDTPRRRLLRISAQLYNSPDQYARLADVLSELVASPDRTRSARP